MPIDTFNYKVLIESSAGADFNVKRAKFGDGYSQQVAVGVNPVMKKASIVFLGNGSEAAQVMAFLESNAGKIFYWKPPLRPQAGFTCDSYRLDDLGGGQWKVRAEFEECALP